MQRVIFDTADILDEFLTRADMKGLTFWQIASVTDRIFADGYRLVRTIKVLETRRKVYMVEWFENGEKDSDEWLRPPENFAAAFAEGYIRDAQKLQI